MGSAASTPVEAAPQQAGDVNTDSQQLPSALVVVGPSGVGKGTLINKLMEGNDKFGFSCSHTTRQPRPGEENGVHYHFTTKEDFEKGIANGEFLEYAYVHSNIYGTSIKAVQDVAASGRCCVLDIDVQGARQVRASNLRAIFVFVAPPSLEELEQRLRGRGTEREEQITTRLNNARSEMASLEEAGLYDCVVKNDDLDRCFGDFEGIAAQALAGKVGKNDDNAINTTTTEQEVDVPGTDSLRNWIPGSNATTAPPTAATSPAAGNTSATNTPDKQQQQQQQPSTSTTDTTQQQQNNTQEEQQPLSTLAVALQPFKNKVAIVTGAGSPIGWQLSLTLAKAGLRVVAASIGKTELENLQHVAIDSGIDPIDFLPVVCDLTKEGEVVALPRIASKRWPGSGVDILINCAHVRRPATSFMSGSTSGWVEMASVNILGAAMVTREVMLDMEKRGEWGHVVNIQLAEKKENDGSGGGGGFYSVAREAMAVMARGLKQEAQEKNVPLRVSTVSLTTEVDPLSISTRSSSSGNGGSGTTDNGGMGKESSTSSSTGVLHVSDVVDAVVWCVAAPKHVDVGSIVVRPN